MEFGTWWEVELEVRFQAAVCPIVEFVVLLHGIVKILKKRGNTGCPISP
jgi:hypothetical protein